MKPLAPPIVCVDGFTMSVQASRHHYCQPRNDEGPYLSVEVGFPSQPESDLLPFAEDAKNPTETVYGYVPVKIVNDIIAKHGGVIAK